MILDPDDAPSPSELIEYPPDRVTLAWCPNCGDVVGVDRDVPTCPACRITVVFLTYEWVQDE